MPPVKCPVCLDYFKKEDVEFVKHKNRYYHKKCFEGKHAEEAEKQKLVDYIEKLLHKKLDYKIRNQLNNYCLKNKFTYQQIYNALFYFYEIKNNSIAKANGGIGIVPYVVDEADEYFKTKEHKATQVNNVNPITEQRIITITDPANRPKYRLCKIINISEL